MALLFSSLSTLILTNHKAIQMFKIKSPFGYYQRLLRKYIQTRCLAMQHKFPEYTLPNKPYILALLKDQLINHKNQTKVPEYNLPLASCHLKKNLLAKVIIFSHCREIIEKLLGNVFTSGKYVCTLPRCNFQMLLLLVMS